MPILHEKIYRNAWKTQCMKNTKKNVDVLDKQTNWKHYERILKCILNSFKEWYTTLIIRNLILKIYYLERTKYVIGKKSFLKKKLTINICKYRVFGKYMHFLEEAIVQVILNIIS